MKLNCSVTAYRNAVIKESAKLGIDPERVFARQRVRIVVIARTRAMKQLRDRGCSLPAIGKASAYDHSSVLHLLRRLPQLEEWLGRFVGDIEPESEPRPTNRWTAGTVESLRRLYHDGLSMSAIANRLGNGFTANAVSGKVQRLGLPARKLPPVMQRVGPINPWREDAFAWRGEW